MRPCTSTNLHEIFMDDHYHFTIEQSMAACREAGFKCIDLNLHTATLPGGPLADDESWKDWVMTIASLKSELGIETPYAHTHFYVVPESSLEEHEKLLCRSIEAAGMLGVKWIVVHPYSVCDSAWYSHAQSLEYNLRYMRKYAEIAKRYNGLGLAIENMVEDRKKRRYGSCAEDLLELAGALNDPIFALCWDFGHAQRSSIDQNESLRQMGKLLKVVHVHDVNVDCDHTLPFFGTTDWAEIMPTMKEIGFEGDWNFECHNYSRFLPLECRKTALKLAFEINKAMISMSEASSAAD
jgi:sugar phosphate isomerase/epimerase